MSGSAFDIELDEVTLSRARRGDLPARERIFRLYHQPAYAIAYRVCHCPELAQDVTQEAFISAFTRLKQFRGDAPFWGWLRRVVVNHAISALRRAPGAAIVELEDYHACEESDAGRIELGLDLGEALAQLDRADRAVVWLYDVEGYSHAEIAEYFGLTESFSKTRLSRARARLRELIHPSNGPDGESSADSKPATGSGARQAARSGAPFDDSGDESGARPARTAAGHGDDDPVTSNLSAGMPASG